MDNNSLWNQKDLPQPPVNSYKSTKEDLDLTKLRNALQDGINHFKDHFLITEAALLSRIIYRMKMKLRNAKDFKITETLSRSLNIYFKTNLARHLKVLLDMVPKKYDADTYLPTKNMLSYILVKLQGIVKLMEKMYDTTQQLALQLTQRLHIGHFWKVFLILFGLISRVSLLVKFNTKFFCELYGKLYPHLLKLENIGRNWLPEDYYFPADLQSWLGVDWVYEDVYVDLTPDQTNDIMNFFNLVDDDDDDVLFCDEYIVIDDEDKNIENDFKKLSPIKEALKRNRMRGFSFNEDDIGEEIIEINDTVNADIIEDSTILEDVGEEICLRDDNANEKNIVTIDESTIIEDVGEEICVNDNTNNGEVIILDDTLANEKSTSSVKKSKKLKRKSQKVTKRKLGFDEEPAKKKTKQETTKKNKLKNTDLDLEIVQQTEVPQQKIKKKESNKIEKENVDSSVILLDSDDSFEENEAAKKSNKSKTDINYEQIVNILTTKTTISKTKIKAKLNKLRVLERKLLKCKNERTKYFLNIKIQKCLEKLEI